MEIKYINPSNLAKQENYINDILDILTECDKEFIPSLSSRSSTEQTDFITIENKNINNKPLKYLNKVVEQNNILVIDNGTIIAFMSFIHNYKSEFFNNDNFQDINNYISTICVRKNFRNQGIAEILYEYIENNLPKDIKSQYVSTRTWSTNIPHISLLKKRNYEITHISKDDRALPNGDKIDTFYFGKRLR